MHDILYPIFRFISSSPSSQHNGELPFVPLHGYNVEKCPTLDKVRYKDPDFQMLKPLHRNAAITKQTGEGAHIFAKVSFVNKSHKEGVFHGNFKKKDAFCITRA